MLVELNNNLSVSTKVNNLNVNASINRDAKDVVWRRVDGCQNFQKPVTISEAVEAVGADYKVTKEHLIRVSDDIVKALLNNDMSSINFTLSKEQLISSHMATVRAETNTTLGVVGSSYGVVQNSKAFEFIDIITSGKLGGDRPIIETAGILGNGKRMYVSAKMPQDMYINGNSKDAVSDYILFTNSHDGSGAVTVLFTPVRVICQNTLNYALKTAQNKLIFKHTSRVGERLDWEKKENMERAIAVLKMHEKFKQSFLDSLVNLNTKLADVNKDTIRFAANVYVDAKQLKLIEQNNFNVDTVAEISTRAKNQIAALRNTIESGIGQESYKGTKLWLFNGLTTFFANEQKYKDSEKNFDSLLDGDASKKVQKAYQFLIAA